MDIHTDSSMPVVNIGLTCFEKARENQEPVFVLRAQDASAGAVVKFWIKAQRRLQASLDAGLTLDQAVKALESYYMLGKFYAPLTPKQAGALVIAEAMAKWPTRMLAD